MKNKEATVKYVSWLLESAISSVLLEQAEQLAPVAPTEPAPDPAQAQTSPVDPSAQDPNAEQQPQATMSLDDLIEKLNLIRGGRSFTDPEVYTKMGELFKTFSDQQKVDLDSGLSKIIDVIVNPDEQVQQQQQQPGNAPQVPQSTTPQPPPASPTPQAGAPSSSPIA